VKIQAKRRKRRAVSVLSLLGASCLAVLVAASASAHVAAAPQSSAPPTVTGQAQEGKTLAADNGTWSNSPTSFSYQWQQCDQNGSSCQAIAGATQKSYSVAKNDADHTLRVQVTATNADGSGSATSQATSVVSSKDGPTNTAAPTVSGTAKIGEQLAADPGKWTGGVSSFSYQWQRCDAGGGACVSIPDETAKVYGVRSVDQGNTLRVVVTATNLGGATNAVSTATALVASNVPTPAPAPAPAPKAKNHAPTIAYVGLRRLGHRIYARFSLCDDSPKLVTVIERDVMPGRLGYSRRFAVAPKPCGTHARTWMLIPRFQHAGRFTSSLRAIDKSGASSRTVVRTIYLNSGV
jgi:hypothetical protein